MQEGVHLATARPPARLPVWGGPTGGRCVGRGRPHPPPHWPRVTLRHLATGLPREAPGGGAPALPATAATAAAEAAATPPSDAPPLAPQPQATPVAAWTAALHGIPFAATPDTRWTYSNFRAGLLGHALARVIGSPSFAAAVRRWVLQPAGMATSLVPDGGCDSGGGEGEVASPHDDVGPVLPTAFTDATAAAGGARALAADMVGFGAFCLAAATEARPRTAAAAGVAAAAGAEAAAAGPPHGGATPNDPAALAAACARRSPPRQ